MRIAAGLLAILIGIVLPAIAMAEDEAASFAARWPQTPMREPTIAEMVSLAASVAKDDIKQAIEPVLSGARQKSWRCRADFCQLLKTH